MNQTKKVSLIEALTNTGVGLLLAFTMNALLFTLVGLHASATQNAIVVGGHTVLSVLRQYVLRRLFNSEFWKRRAI